MNLSWNSLTFLGGNPWFILMINDVLLVSFTQLLLVTSKQNLDWILFKMLKVEELEEQAFWITFNIFHVCFSDL